MAQLTITMHVHPRLDEDLLPVLRAPQRLVQSVHVERHILPAARSSLRRLGVHLQSRLALVRRWWLWLGEGSRHMDLRGNIRWVSLTFDYTTDLVGEDSWKWTMAGSKKNCIGATKGKCDVKNQLDLGSIDFLQHQHPSSITGSSQAGVGDP